jgi:hypothetical protein
MAVRTRPTATTLDFTLLENGLDFLLHAVEHLSGEPSERDLKQGVINLAGGVELILKERLRRHDWRLLFADQARASAQDLATGNFKSVGPGLTIARLCDEAGVLLEPATDAALNRLRLQRNQINHLAITVPAGAVIALAAAALAFALDFVGDELDGDDLEGRAAVDLELLRQATVEFKSFVDERWRSIKPRVEQAIAIVTCADCGQDAAEIDDGVRCHFCGYRATPQIGAEEFAAQVLGASYYDSVKNAEYWPISFCPDCGMETLIDEGLNDASEFPTRQWVCFSCACAWDDNALHSCDSCGAFHPDKLGIGMCDNCFDWRVNGPGSG